MNTLTDEEYDLCLDVVDVIYPLYCEMFPEEKGINTEASLIDYVCEFALIFQNDKGIETMMDFIKWARENGQLDKDMLVAVMHDINHRNDRLMEPRTARYLKEN